MKKISAIIFDVDNTLYSFTAFFVPAFQTMLDKLSEKSGVSQEQLKKEFRAIHQKAGTSEYVFAVQSLPSLQKLHPGEDIAAIYADAIKAYQEKRRENLKLYDGVMETLQQIKDSGTRIIAYTESPGYHIMHRLKRLGLDGVIDVLYALPDHPIPEGTDISAMRSKSSDKYRFEKTQMFYTPHGILKPNPETASGIVEDLNIPADQILYVGDHIMKDVTMAKQLGLNAAHAKYGTYENDPSYALLKEISYWTDEMIAQEAESYKNPPGAPDVVLKDNISELFLHYDFVPYTGKPGCHDRLKPAEFSAKAKAGSKSGAPAP